jgi:hypothetical protein
MRTLSLDNELIKWNNEIEGRERRLKQKERGKPENNYLGRTKLEVKKFCKVLNFAEGGR